MKKYPITGFKRAVFASIALAHNLGLTYSFATLGLFGDNIKKMLDNFSDDEKAKDILIPIGIDHGGQSLALAFPLDDMTAQFTRLALHVFRGEIDEAVWSAAKPAIPTLNPALEAFIYLFNMSNGQAQRLGATPRDIQAGGWYKWKHFVRHMYNSFSPTTVIYRWPKLNMDVELRRAMDKDTHAVLKTMSWILDLPLAQLFGFGLVRRSNQGQVEAVRRAQKPANQATAIGGILVDELVLLKAQGNKDLEAVRSIFEQLTTLAKEGPAQLQAVKAAFDNMDIKLKKAILGGTADPYLVEYLNASKAQQMSMLLAGWKKYLETGE